MPDTFGCSRCWPEPADAAWDARAALTMEFEPIDESHFHVMVLRCAGCEQRFVSVFTETIDWEDGEDPQHWTLLPVTREEAARLARPGAAPTEAGLNALGPGRRSLCLSHPKGEPSRAYWSLGLHVGPHD